MAAFNNGLVKYPKNFTMYYQELVWAVFPKPLNSALSYCCFRTFQIWLFSLLNNFFCRSSENVLISDDTDMLMIPTYSFLAQIFLCKIHASKWLQSSWMQRFHWHLRLITSRVSSCSCSHSGLLLLSHIHIRSVTKSYNFTCQLCFESIIIILAALNQNSKWFFGSGSFLTSTPLFPPLPTYSPHNRWRHLLKLQSALSFSAYNPSPTPQCL